MSNIKKLEGFYKYETNLIKKFKNNIKLLNIENIDKTKDILFELQNIIFRLQMFSEIKNFNNKK